MISPLGSGNSERARGRVDFFHKLTIQAWSQADLNFGALPIDSTIAHHRVTGYLSATHILGFRHTRLRCPGASLVVSNCSEPAPGASALASKCRASSIVEPKSCVLRTRIHRVINHLFLGNKVVTVEVILTSIHARTIACYRHFASGPCASDVMKPPTVVLPGVHLKMERSGQTIPNRKTEISQQDAATWHTVLETRNAVLVPS
jgi:hypothetical protein